MRNAAINVNFESDVTLIRKAIYSICRDLYSGSAKGSIDYLGKAEKLAKLLLIYPALLKPKHKRDKNALCAEFESRLLDCLLPLMSGMDRYGYRAREIEATLGCRERLIDLAEGGTYSGLALTRCMRYAVANYGKLDIATGERIPFAKLFFSAFKRKRKDRYREAVGFVGHSGLVETIPLMVCDGDGCEWSVTEQAEANAWNVSEAEGKKLLSWLGLVLPNVQGLSKRNLRRDIPAYITLCIGHRLDSFGATTRTALCESLDAGLLEFIEKNSFEVPSDVECPDAFVYSLYLGIKYDTARKRLNSAKSQLSKLFLLSSNKKKTANVAKRADRTKRAV